MLIRPTLFLAVVVSLSSCAGADPELADILTPQQIAEDLEKSGDPGEDLDAAPADPSFTVPAQELPGISGEEPEQAEDFQNVPLPPPRPQFPWDSADSESVKPKLPAHLAAHGARNRLVIVVDKSEQHLYLIEQGRLTNSWDVSTGMPGEDTPNGAFPVTRQYYRYVSKQYKARMDRAIFFFEGVALHATYGENIRLLGPRKDRKVGYGYSRGCVRQSPERADFLWDRVKFHGARNVTIIVQD